MKEKLSVEALMEKALRALYHGQFDEGAAAVGVIKRHRLLTCNGLELFLGCAEDYSGVAIIKERRGEPIDFNEDVLSGDIADCLKENGVGDEFVDDEKEAGDAVLKICQMALSLLADYEHGYLDMRDEDAEKLRALIDKANAEESKAN